MNAKTKTQQAQAKELALIRLNQELIVAQHQLKQAKSNEVLLFLIWLIAFALGAIRFGFTIGALNGIAWAITFWFIDWHRTKPYKERIREIQREIDKVTFEWPPFDDD